MKKVKKHDYPWPKNPDPNVKGGILFHLSSFKPLEEKPKPVTLEFEKPLVELEKKINDVKSYFIILVVDLFENSQSFDLIEQLLTIGSEDGRWNWAGLQWSDCFVRE